MLSIPFSFLWLWICITVQGNKKIHGSKANRALEGIPLPDPPNTSGCLLFSFFNFC